jgi:hypothetical protein
MRILDLCGGSGAWSKPYADAGYDVEIIDPILDGRDVRLLQAKQGRIHGILAAPPCTVWSYARNRYPPSEAEQLLSLSVVDALLADRGGTAPEMVGDGESPQQAPAVSRAGAARVLSVGIRRCRAQANVYLGRLYTAAETAEAENEAEHLADETRECTARRCDYAAELCASLLRKQPMRSAP